MLPVHSSAGDTVWMAEHLPGSRRANALSLHGITIATSWAWKQDLACVPAVTHLYCVPSLLSPPLFSSVKWPQGSDPATLAEGLMRSNQALSSHSACRESVWRTHPSPGSLEMVLHTTLVLPREQTRSWSPPASASFPTPSLGSIS